METPDNTVRTPQKPGSLKRLLQTVVLTSLLVTGGLAALRFFGLWEPLEIAAYDRFIRLRGNEPLDDRVLVVGIDEADIQSREEYPITEGTVIDLLEALENYAPRAIALDFALDFPQGTDAERAQLTELLAGSDNIVAACVMSDEQAPGVPPPPGISEDLVGFADFPVDKDGVTRRSMLVSIPTALPDEAIVRPHLCNQPDPELPLFSLSFILADIYLSEEGIIADQTEVGDIIWDNTLVSGLYERSGGYASTGATDYQVMLNYRAARDAVRQVNMTDVLEGRVDPDWVRDRIVLVGYTTPYVNDVLTTPYPETREGTRSMYGVVVHAQATSQLISAVLEGRPLITSWPEIGEIFLMAVVGVAGGLVAFYGRRPILWILGTAVGVLVLWGGAYFIFLQGLWLPVVPMTLASVVTAIGVGVVNQAKQSVYAQAIFEQLQARLSGQTNAQATSERDRLDDLVRRAQAIRERRAIGGVLERGDIDQAATDPLHLEFDSPEVQTFYERIKGQLQEKFDAEKATMTAQSTSTTSDRASKLQSLLRKSQSTRGAAASSEPVTEHTSNE